MRKPVITMREAINEAMRIAFLTDPNVFIMGSDIATYGGQLRCTYGLLELFGEERVRDTPISEMGYVGAGVGSAMHGKRPIIELSYSDFIGTSFDQILNQAAKMRYMYGGKYNVPLVIRTQGGAGLGNGAQHSQMLESILAHIPGLRVIMPSDAYDAKGLLLRAIRDNNPVIFYEHKGLYKQKAEVPIEPYEIDYVPDVKREGTDLTIVTYSAMVPKSLKAAEKLEEEGISIEVVDVRSLNPLDPQIIIESVKKTGRAMIVHEAVLHGGFGGEIAAILSEKAFAYLKAPITRVAAPNTPVPFAKVLEDAYVPNEEDIIAGVKRVLKKEAVK